MLVAWIIDRAPCHGVRMVWIWYVIQRKFCAPLPPPHPIASPFAEMCAKISIAMLTPCRCDGFSRLVGKLVRFAMSKHQSILCLISATHRRHNVSAWAMLINFQCLSLCSPHLMCIVSVHKLDECSTTLVAFNCLIVQSQTCEWYWICKQSRRSSTVSMRERVTNRDVCVLCAFAPFSYANRIAARGCDLYSACDEVNACVWRVCTADLVKLRVAMKIRSTCIFLTLWRHRILYFSYENPLNDFIEQNCARKAANTSRPACAIQMQEKTWNKLPFRNWAHSFANIWKKNEKVRVRFLWSHRDWWDSVLPIRSSMS